MKVKTVIFNWRQIGSVHDRDGAGEDYDQFMVGKLGVVLIEENVPNETNKGYDYLVHLDNGIKYRVFNPNYVEYFSEKTLNPNT